MHQEKRPTEASHPINKGSLYMSVCEMNIA